MKISVSVATVPERRVPVQVVFVTEKNRPELPPALARVVRQLTASEFNGAERQLYLLAGAAGLGLRAERLLLAGLGQAKSVTPEKVRRAAGAAIKRILSLGLSSACIQVGADQLAPALEAALLANYRFRRFKPPTDNTGELRDLALLLPPGSDARAAKASVRRIQLTCETVNFIRDLGNLPPNVITPAGLAQQARQVARQCRLKCTVWSGPELRRRGFGGLLAVGGGSQNSPHLIVLEYQPKPRRGRTRKPPLALVGKALTFDSGGLSIKPAERMDEMKYDKCGGLAVLGVLRAAAQLQVPRPILGIIAAAENMPSASAYRPGDILTSYRGKDNRAVTIEVLNTDAEGRVVLGDALVYARQRSATPIIDLATLTGACVVALGHHAAGLLGNNEQLIEQLRCAGEATGERCWPLPLWQEYKDQIKSDVADHKNTGGRHGGASTAAAFLANYVGDTPWAHLDIAGTAWTTEDRPYLHKGATGFGVRLLLSWLQNTR